MTIWILESAVEDLARGRRFYSRHGQGVGVYFLNSLFSDVDSLLLCAGVHPKSFGYHRLLSRRFRFDVYYFIEKDVVVVYLIGNCEKSLEQLEEALASSPNANLLRFTTPFYVGAVVGLGDRDAALERFERVRCHAEAGRTLPITSRWRTAVCRRWRTVGSG